MKETDVQDDDHGWLWCQCSNNEAEFPRWRQRMMTMMTQWPHNNEEDDCNDSDDVTE
jgi:hypothetical protein